MHIMHSRRDFLTTLSAADAAIMLGARPSLADDRSAGDDYAPTGPRSRHLHCALVHRRPSCVRRGSPMSVTCGRYQGRPGGLEGST
jgi:hypothetical protein